MQKRGFTRGSIFAWGFLIGLIAGIGIGAATVLLW